MAKIKVKPTHTKIFFSIFFNIFFPLKNKIKEGKNIKLTMKDSLMFSITAKFNDPKISTDTVYFVPEILKKRGK